MVLRVEPRDYQLMRDRAYSTEWTPASNFHLQFQGKGQAFAGRREIDRYAAGVHEFLERRLGSSTTGFWV